MGIVANSTPLTAAAIIYIVFTIPLIRIAARMESRRKKPRPGGKPPQGVTPEAEMELFNADISAQLPKGGEGW
jgi:hypothetical protein